jgi:putative NIF3 family GTP cyclohydrolase 1 type 2
MARAPRVAVRKAGLVRTRFLRIIGATKQRDQALIDPAVTGDAAVIDAHHQLWQVEDDQVRTAGPIFHRNPAPSNRT